MFSGTCRFCHAWSQMAYLCYTAYLVTYIVHTCGPCYVLLWACAWWQCSNHLSDQVHTINGHVWPCVRPTFLPMAHHHLRARRLTTVGQKPSALYHFFAWIFLVRPSVIALLAHWAQCNHLLLCRLRAGQCPKTYGTTTSQNTHEVGTPQAPFFLNKFGPKGTDRRLGGARGHQRIF